MLYSREERERWRQGPRCLRCSKLRRIGGLRCLTMAPRRSSGCGAPRVDYTQGPWTAVIRRHRRFAGSSVFHTSFRVLLSLLATQQKRYHDLQQVVQSLIPHIYYIHRVQHIRWCTQQTVCSTHTHTHTVTELFVYIPLYSSLYLFEYCCSHLNSWTVHPDIVYRNRKRPLLLSTVNGLRRTFLQKCQVL